MTHGIAAQCAQGLHETIGISWFEGQIVRTLTACRVL